MRRRQGLGLWAIILLVAMVPIGSGFAQDATPSDADGPVRNTPNPVLSDTVSYITESGSEVARLRVSEVVVPWEEYGEYFAPDVGTIYIAFVIEITNLGSRGNLIVRGDDFRVQDVDGFFYSRSWADADDGAEIVPTESEVVIGPDETGELIAVYGVLDGVQLSHLFWQPDYDRLVTAANLDEVDTAAP